ncbi:thioredoxin family protein [Rhodococcus sp. NPDC003318]|uniref:thioredoxin family protein n=1 Tax=Rhodococcus sp. NPDC003318 TaxID=3364503 RepID=UPI00369FB3B9
MALASTTDSDFAADVLGSDLPVLVDFTAASCGPCRMVAPVLDQIAGDLDGRLRILTLDVAANPVTTGEYQVMGTPTLALFVGGERVVRLAGAKSRAAILREIEPHLPN